MTFRLHHLALAAALAAGPATAQEADADTWDRRAEAAQATLVRCFWNDDAALFDLAFPRDPEERRLHYWWQAHALDALVDGFERSGRSAYLERAAQLWSGVKRRNGGVTIDYYDDMLWMGLALQRLHAHTGDATLRADVAALWADIRAGWNDAQGGGIAWCKTQRDYKNTPANAPAVILGVRLHRAHAATEDLDFATRVYAWLDETLVDPKTGFVWDGKNRRGDGATDKDWAFTYNQGTRIGAAVELFRATADRRYLRDAAQTFAAARARLTDDEGMLRERGEGDGGLFKGIFVRYLGELVRVDPDAGEKAREFLVLQAQRAWAQRDTGPGDADETALFAADWRRPTTRPVELSVQLSGVMLFEQVARLARLPQRAR